MDDCLYAPELFLKEEYANADITDFFVVDSGIIAIINYEQINELRRNRKRRDENVIVSTKMSLEEMKDWLPVESMTVVNRAFEWLDEMEKEKKNEN